MFLLSEKLWYLFPSCRPAPPVFAEVRTARALPAVVCHFWDGCISRHFCMVPLIQVDPSLSMHPKPCSFDSIDYPASWRESSWALSCILCSSGWVPVLDHSKDAKDPMRRWNAEEHRPCYTNVNSTNKRIKMKSDNKKKKQAVVDDLTKNIQQPGMYI